MPCSLLCCPDLRSPPTRTRACRAVGLPVTLFLATAFAIANDSEAPESWLEWVGWRKIVFGTRGNRKWHYTRGAPPHRHVKWFVRSVGAPPTETMMNLIVAVKCAITGEELPWHVEAREAEEEEEEERAEADAQLDDGKEAAMPAAAGDGSEKSGSGGSTSSSVRSARELQSYKRKVMALGLGSVYFCWAIFAWCVRCARQHQCVHFLCRIRADWFFAARIGTVPPRPRFIFTYGMLLYKLLGEKAEAEFARGWGISYAMGAVTEWRPIVEEAIKGAIILAILERLLLTRHSNWLEVRLPLCGTARRRLCGQRVCAYAWCASLLPLTALMLCADALPCAGAHRLPQLAVADAEAHGAELLRASAHLLHAHTPPRGLARARTTDTTSTG
jgi:hypothetical protein